jgi:hypothetical protein
MRAQDTSCSPNLTRLLIAPRIISKEENPDADRQFTLCDGTYNGTLPASQVSHELEGVSVRQHQKEVMLI